MVVENISPFCLVRSATCGAKSKKGFSMSLAKCVADVKKQRDSFFHVICIQRFGTKINV